MAQGIYNIIKLRECLRFDPSKSSCSLARGYDPTMEVRHVIPRLKEEGVLPAKLRDRGAELAIAKYQSDGVVAVYRNGQYAVVFGKQEPRANNRLIIAGEELGHITSQKDARGIERTLIKANGQAVREDPSLVHANTDVLLGVVLYELFSGKLYPEDRKYGTVNRRESRYKSPAQARAALGRENFELDEVCRVKLTDAEDGYSTFIKLAELKGVGALVNLGVLAAAGAEAAGNKVKLFFETDFRADTRFGAPTTYHGLSSEPDTDVATVNERINAAVSLFKILRGEQGEEELAALKEKVLAGWMKADGYAGFERAGRKRIESLMQRASAIKARWKSWENPLTGLLSFNNSDRS